jgi:hypothetical protein
MRTLYLTKTHRSFDIKLDILYSTSKRFVSISLRYSVIFWTIPYIALPSIFDVAPTKQTPVHKQKINDIAVSDDEQIETKYYFFIHAWIKRRQ